MAVKCPKCKFDNPDGTRFCGNCAAPLHANEDAQASLTKTLEAPGDELRRGTLFAKRYEIIEKLGTGGMGAVYRAEDTKIGQDIALKLIKPQIASDKKTIERFRNELKTTRMISHRNVCRMFDMGETADTFYITMEYVSGEDLKSFIRRSGRLDIPKAVAIAREVCEGLSEAHRLDVVHRDLKSNNIMIDKKGNARIMDFGIARSVSAKGLTGEGVIIGTPEYMSPEQAEAKEVDQRSDIYSLGVILYEMVTGRVPFEGDTVLSIAMKHKGEMPRDPKLLHAQIPEDLNRTILRCLEKDKEKRYQSAGELRSELEAIEKGIPTTARAVPERKPFTSKEITVQFSLKKLFIPALIAVVVVVIGLIFWKFFPGKKTVSSFPSDKPSLAIMYFMNQTGDETLDHWREALPGWLITDLSQSKYINVLSSDRLFSILKNLDLLEAKNYASEDLKDVAREGGVDYIFQARFSKAGDIFRIDYSLQKADKLEILASDHVKGQSEESFPSLIDEITKKIKANLEFSKEQMTSDIDKDAGTITSSSPEAFKYYSIGRKYLDHGEDRKGIELMEQAVAVDPEFAMAYRGMAIAYGNLNYYAKAKEILQKALEFKDRLSDRDRYRIEADFYSREEKTYNKAFEAYGKLLEIYPDEQGARHNLAVLYGSIEETQKAIEQYEILINEYNTDSLLTYTNLAGAYNILGFYEKAREILKDYMNHFSDNTLIHQFLSDTYLYQGRYELALEELNKAFALAPTDWSISMLRGDIYFYLDDPGKAEEEYRKLLEKEEPVARSMATGMLGSLFKLEGRFKDSIAMAKTGIEQAEKVGERSWKRNRLCNLAEMDVVLGNPEEALKTCELVWKSAVEDEDLGYKRRVLNIKALAYIEMDRKEEAKKTAEELREMINQGINKNHIRLYYHLMGRMALEKENYGEAIEFFKKGLPFVLPTSAMLMIYADSMGLAYYKSGDMEKAREEYQKMASPEVYRLNNGDLYAKSFYMLGKISEELGETTKAKEYYGKFLDLWKAADPGLPEVDDAKKRLTAIMGSQLNI
jgi:tetratricopeptide (TPR) repeat protein